MIEFAENNDIFLSRVPSHEPLMQLQTKTKPIRLQKCTYIVLNNKRD